MLCKCADVLMLVSGGEAYGDANKRESGEMTPSRPATKIGVQTCHVECSKP